jgi:hypothetical protein
MMGWNAAAASRVGSVTGVAGQCTARGSDTGWG